MNRIILKSTLVAILFFTAIGVAVPTIYATENVVVDDNEKSQIGVEIDFAELLKDKTTAAMLDTNPDLPAFVKSMTDISLYVSLPDSMEKMSDPSNVNFALRLEFSKAEACEAAYEDMISGPPTEDVELKGKTYKKIDAPGAPVVYILKDDKTIKAFSEVYVNSDSDDFASKGLKTALGKAPKEPFKMAVDIQSMKGLIGEMAAFAPQAAAFSEAESLMMAGGGQGQLMYMMSVATPDEATAKKVKSSIQAVFALVAGAAAAQMPPEDKAPALNEMINHVLGELRPKIDDTTVKVVINKPENYEELRKKLMNEMEKLGADF